MKLVVISPEYADPREREVLGAMLAAGLERYHVRRPHATAAELAAWLEALPAEWRRRLVLHQHHELVERYALGGYHRRDVGSTAAATRGARPAYHSRSTHDVADLQALLGAADAVFFSPVFPSISKPGYARSPALPVVSRLLAARTARQRLTTVYALGGVAAENIAHARELGFDGGAVLGAIWQAEDPVRAFQDIATAAAARPTPPAIMCLTQDGLPLSHAEQARQLCAAGARWIQLRMKQAALAEWERTAREVVAICRAHGATCIVNDSVDVALAAGADGVHLGRRDLDWSAARARLGPRLILGGTVNDAADAARAVAAGVLDYVGVGPLRFTTTKQKLAPVLGLGGVRALVAALGGLPAWVIGGVTATDLPAIAETGAAGAAISGALFSGATIAASYRALHAAWPVPAVASLSA